MTGPRLLPEPMLRRTDGGEAVPVQRLADPITGIGPDSDAWRRLGADAPGGLGAEAYALRLHADGPAVLAAVDAAGLAHGRRTLRRLAQAEGPLPAQTIRDHPALGRRGVVEGFYGAPWSSEERIAFLAFAGRVGLNEYVYAPKDDPYHRERWREPYPAPELERLQQVTAAAAENGVRFVYALSPALSMRFSDPHEHELLARKAEQLWSAGVRSVVLLFDDVPTGLADPDDRRRFGDGPAGTGRAHGDACARFQDAFLRPRGQDEPVTMCPTDYAGCAASPYRDGLAETLPQDAIVLWTGSDIVVGEVTREDVDRAAASYGRRLMLWDNFPVNDFDRSRLFLGPLLGRTTDLEGSALVGVLANPMVEAAPSRFALASTADWAWNPTAYDPAASAAVALDVVAGPSASALAPLVDACSSWPPGAPQSTALLQLTEAALDGDAGALDRLEATGRRLLGASTPPAPEDADRALLTALAPWLSATRDAGSALVLACALLRELEADRRPASRDAVHRALVAAEGHYANVLRSVVPPFVRSVLARAGEPIPEERPGPRVLLLTGANPAPGDRDLAERLIGRGCTVDVRDRWDRTVQRDLVIVTPAAPRAEAAAVKDAAVPVLAWGRLETLGLGRASRVLLSQDAVDVVAPGDPLAGGLRGRVRIYRGPGAITCCIPVEGAAVVARSTTGEAVLARIPQGAALTDGAPAAADRVAFFLATDGLAPWLVAPEGHALLTAAVDLLTAPSPAAAEAALAAVPG